ncbi:MAG: protein ImuB [Alphaproteobacteria bacterium]|nr:protein ImuB [Alphaproteobacteria bacterium]
MWLRRLSTDRIERCSSEPVEAFVVVTPIKSAQRITALTDGAARLGLKAGMGLADARARYPSLPVVEADPEADRRLLEAVADWCDRYTPLAGLDAPDGLFLDVTGCAHLFGGEAALARDLVTRLAQQGLRARAAIADTAGCAWAVARYGKPGIVACGDTEAAMLPLPMAALRVDAETVADLKTSGLTCVGDLAARPRAPFAARFGKGLLLRLDQALGRADEPITPRLPVPAAMAEQRFPEPIAREADVLGTIEHLGRQLVPVLDRRGEGGRLFQAALFRADGKVHRLEIGTGSPLRDPERVRKLFEERLAVLGDACDPGFGYDMVRLSALVTERMEPAQTGLAGPDHADELAHLIDRLGARFGLRRVSRLVPQDTHIPEYAVAAVPAHAVACPGRSAAPSARLRAFSTRYGDALQTRDPGFLKGRQPGSRISGASLTRCTASGTRAETLEQDSLFPIRPLRLFARPEPVEAIAQVPDGPPVRFSWRHVTHQVARVEGPERIAMEWWRDDRGNKLTRDYFRVENDVGARMWLYREGLYGREIEPPEAPRWYLHGLFA